MDDVSRSAILGAVGELRAAGTATERGDVVSRVAGALGISMQTAYRQLRAAGWSSGRKARRDRGASRVSVENLDVVAGLMARGRNKRGSPNVPTKEAHKIAVETGLVETAISYPQLARRLRQTGRSMVHMRAPEASVARVSDHPNHVWFFDISVAIQWYFRDGAGKRLDLYNDAGARFYEGKRANFATVKKVIHRFAAVDHTTGAYFVRYYYSAGEAEVDVVDFLYRAMAKKPNGASFPFRGVPARMVLDQGPANKSAGVRNLLEELGVKVEYHKAGNAKASGTVETRHNLWQRSFEGRLAVAGGAADLDQLNGWAEKYAAIANAENPHTRHGRPPMQAWLDIDAEQLVEAPDRRTFLQLATRAPREGTLNNYLQLRADGRRWFVEGENVYPGQKIRYRLGAFLENGLRAWDADDNELAVTELTVDRHGFVEQGPRHKWDDATAPGATAPAPAAQKIARRVVEDATLARAPTVFDDLAARAERYAYIERVGRAWAPKAGSELVAPTILASLDAREEIVRRLGRALTRDEAAWWKDRIGTGIAEGELEAAWTQFGQDDVAAGGAR